MEGEMGVKEGVEVVKQYVDPTEGNREVVLAVGLEEEDLGSMMV